MKWWGKARFSAEGYTLEVMFENDGSGLRRITSPPEVAGEFLPNSATIIWEDPMPKIECTWGNPEEIKGE